MNVKVNVTGIVLREGDNIGAKLRSLRKMRKLTTSQFGISQGNVSNIETGISSPKTSTLVKYMKTLGLNKLTVYFYTGKVDLECSVENIREELKKLSTDPQTDKKSRTKSAVIRYRDEKEQDSSFDFYMKYAKILGVRKLIINF